MLPPLRGNLDDQHKLVVQIRSAVSAMSYYLWDVLGVGGILAGPCDGVSGSEGNLKVTGSGRWRTCNRLMQNVIPPPLPPHTGRRQRENFIQDQMEVVRRVLLPSGVKISSAFFYAGFQKKLVRKKGIPRSTRLALG